MANEEHLAILRQGVEVWNKWRRENQWGTIPDLFMADLQGMNLVEADLFVADLTDANLVRANLFGANLNGSELSGANLTAADLTQAKLWEANLEKANLNLANLSLAYLNRTKLRDANLQGTNLEQTHFYDAVLDNADFANANCGLTKFDYLDLSKAKNLHLTHHRASSTIGIDTLYKSGGNIPRKFLEGCGIPEAMILFGQSLADKAKNFYSCFIRYVPEDEEFASQLYERMKQEGLRVWLSPEARQEGDYPFYSAFRHSDKLILVFSDASMMSNFIDFELKFRLQKMPDGRIYKQLLVSLVPFDRLPYSPIFNNVDNRDFVQEIHSHFVSDFSQWKNYDTFNIEFEKLLKALRAED